VVVVVVVAVKASWSPEEVVGVRQWAMAVAYSRVVAEAAGAVLAIPMAEEEEVAVHHYLEDQPEVVVVLGWY
jgi:hypothetical protein